MLIEFKVKNYKSIRDEQLLSLVANSEQRLPENVFVSQFESRKLVHSAVLYGANASGKTNLLQAIIFVKMFVQLSAKNGPDAEIPVHNFRLDEHSITEPSEFEMTFIQEGVRYQFGFVVDRKRIYEEWLLAYPKGSAQTWYERSWNNDSGQYDWRFGSHLKGQKHQLTPLVSDNSLFLSVAVNFNQVQLTTVYEWFVEKLQLLHIDNVNILNQLATLTLENQDDNNLLTRVVDLLSQADTGIVNLSLEDRKISHNELPANMPEKMKSAFKTLMSLNDDKPTKEVVMWHQFKGGENSGIPFLLDDESLGTQRLFGLSIPLLRSLEKGAVFVIDELDASLHPHLVRHLVQLFHNPKTNPNHAQLIFNTHDTSLLDEDVFRRDQVWFVEKDDTGASQLFSLMEFKERSTTSFGKAYKQGRYGAVPILTMHD